MVGDIHEGAVHLNESLVTAPLGLEFGGDHLLPIPDMTFCACGHVGDACGLCKRAEAFDCRHAVIVIECRNDFACPVVPAFNAVSVDH